MVITVLTGKVDHDRRADLDRAYRELISAGLPPFIQESFLLRDTNDESSWKIITLWSSLEALTEMRARTRATGSKPAGVLAFEAAGATPTLAVLDVVTHVTQ